MKRRTWLVTGATRGLGFEIVRAALEAGDQVAGTGREASRVERASDADHERLLSLCLDVTDRDSIAAAVGAACARFGAIDVLVNNAGYGQFGMVEELSLEEFVAQFATNVFGMIDVTKAVLPIMRRQRSGRIFNVSSIAGVRGAGGSSAYCASKFAVEGFSESLAKEVAPFGIAVTILQPGFFRTEFLTPRSARYGSQVVDEYARASRDKRAYFDQRSGHQPGDPRKLAAAVVSLAGVKAPPIHFPVGVDAVEAVTNTLDSIRNELDAWRELSVSTDG
jgi:NAD(P)-dependent dehydrogenase (short-subunit alcohol dehydrogenase family)